MSRQCSGKVCKLFGDTSECVCRTSDLREDTGGPEPPPVAPGDNPAVAPTLISEYAVLPRRSIRKISLGMDRFFSYTASGAMGRLARIWWCLWELPDCKGALPGDDPQWSLANVAGRLAAIPSPVWAFIGARATVGYWSEWLSPGWRCASGVIGFLVLAVLAFGTCKVTRRAKRIRIAHATEEEPRKYWFGPSDRIMLKIAIFASLFCVGGWVGYYKLTRWDGPIHRVEDKEVVREVQPGDFQIVKQTPNMIVARLTLDCDHLYTGRGDLSVSPIELTELGKKNCIIEDTDALRDGKPIKRAVHFDSRDPDYHTSQFIGIRSADKFGMIDVEIKLKPANPAQKFPRNVEIGDWVHATINRWGRTTAGK